MRNEKLKSSDGVEETHDIFGGGRVLHWVKRVGFSHISCLPLSSPWYRKAVEAGRAL
jgi:hypothetical protein